MTHSEKCNLRVKIITAAQEAGHDTTYKFAKLCESIGIPYSTSFGYYTGQHDMTGAKLDILLKYFDLEVNKTRLRITRRRVKGG